LGLTARKSHWASRWSRPWSGHRWNN